MLTPTLLSDGDISYADGVQDKWDVFMRKIQPISTRIPYMVSVGNHEHYYNFRCLNDCIESSCISLPEPLPSVFTLVAFRDTCTRCHFTTEFQAIPHTFHSSKAGFLLRSAYRHRFAMPGVQVGGGGGGNLWWSSDFSMLHGDKRRHCNQYQCGIA